MASPILLVLASPVIHGSRTLPVILAASVAFLILGPYSFLAGAIALGFGGKRSSGTASGLIDGVGYLGGTLAGDSMARITVKLGWSGAFFTLAAVALVSSVAAAWFFYEERSRVHLAESSLKQ